MRPAEVRRTSAGPPFGDGGRGTCEMRPGAVGIEEMGAAEKCPSRKQAQPGAGFPSATRSSSCRVGRSEKTRAADRGAERCYLPPKLAPGNAGLGGQVYAASKCRDWASGTSAHLRL